jgi:hypothetical protein
LEAEAVSEAAATSRGNLDIVNSLNSSILRPWAYSEAMLEAVFEPRSHFGTMCFKFNF